MQQARQKINLIETGAGVAKFRKLVVWLMVLLIALVLVGFVLPRQFKVERTVAINAPALTIYPLIAAPANWQQWSVWARRDQSMLMTYSGVGLGKGAKWAWISKQEGNGEMEIIDDVPMRNVVYRLKLADSSMVLNGALTLAPAGDATTKIVWSTDVELGWNPIHRYVGLLMDDRIGKDFDVSLSQLKALAEKTAAVASAPAVPAGLPDTAVPENKAASLPAIVPTK